MSRPELCNADRNAWIDVLRGAAACAVALFHFSCLPVNGDPDFLVVAWRAVLAHGHLGVPVFFVVSGYCITMTWFRSATWSEFGRRRLRRILPPYYASLLLLLVMIAGFKLINGVNDVATLPKTAKAVFATLTLTTWPVTDVPPMNGVYWSLSCEITFYLLMAGLLALPAAWRLNGLVALHAVICGLSSVQVQGIFFADMWPLFGIGAAIAVWPQNRLAARLMAASSVLQTTVIYTSGRPFAYTAVAMIAVGLLWLAPRVSFPGWLRPARQIGVFSYSVYLIHQPVGYFGLMRLMPKTYPGDIAYISGQLLVFLGTLGIAYVFFRLCEEPFLNAPKPTASGTRQQDPPVNSGAQAKAFLRRIGVGRFILQHFWQPTVGVRWLLGFGLAGALRMKWGEARMRRAAARLPAVPAPASTALSATYMTGTHHWHQTAFAAWSLAKVLPDGLQPTFYDDGTLQPGQIASLNRIFPASRIVSRAEAVRNLDECLPRERFPLLRAAEDRCLFMRKLVALRAGSCRWQLYLDSDMLFFRCPEQLKSAAQSGRAIYMADHVFAYCLNADEAPGVFGNPLVERVNGGLVGLNDAAISWEQVEHWLSQMTPETRIHSMLEQTLTAALMGQQSAQPANPGIYRIMWLPDKPPVEAALLHYIYHSKQLFFSQEWRRVLAIHARPGQV